MCTRIYPKGYNGITIDKINDGRRYMDSLKFSSYPISFPKLVKFDDVETAEELVVAAREYIDKYDKPQISITIDYLDLYNNEEYEQLKEALKLTWGDTVTAHDVDLDITGEVRCIEETVDAITGIKL